MDTEKFITCLEEGMIPDEPPEKDIDSYELRKVATERNMWALVSRDWVKVLAERIKGKRVLEVMAGAGWLAKALSDEGIEILATDDYRWADRNKKMIFSVKKYDGLQAVKDFKNQYNILLVSWPPYSEDEVCDICEEWGGVKPIIYIGEDQGGCNAVDEFFQHYKSVEYFDIPQWWGLHDELTIGYYRKEVIK